ncbi:MAG: hypothetical protein WCE21_05780 [Candidatus Babeliales bacterium]
MERYMADSEIRKKCDCNGDSRKDACDAIEKLFAMCAAPVSDHSGNDSLSQLATVLAVDLLLQTIVEAAESVPAILEGASEELLKNEAERMFLVAHKVQQDHHIEQEKEKKAN